MRARASIRLACFAGTCQILVKNNTSQQSESDGLAVAVYRAPELPEEADDTVARRRTLRQTAATAFEARPDFPGRLHRSSLPGPLPHLHRRAKVAGQCMRFVIRRKLVDHR